VNRCK